ncbi:MAG: hypothetical protein ACI9MB_001949 [Verrucomicrobiales bacterium]|jgi:hypothetical protein
MRNKVGEILVFGGLGVIALIFLPLLRNEATVDYSGRNMLAAISLARNCRGYALDHGGATPASLVDFYAAEEYWEDFEPARLDYFDPDSEQRMAWLYFPVKDIGEGDSETLFLVSPIACKGKRVVVFTDSSAKVVREKECEEMLRNRRGR